MVLLELFGKIDQILGVAPHKPSVKDEAKLYRPKSYYVIEDSFAAKNAGISGSMLTGAITVYSEHDYPKSYFADPLTEQIRFRNIPGVDLTGERQPQEWFTYSPTNQILLPFKLSED